jgi:D-3-phosphoglycerate dehydrogenase
MKLFIADKIADEGVEFLKQHAGFDVDFSPGLDESEACEHIRDCDAIIIRSATTLRGAILDAGTQLKVIGRAGIGVDNIDVETATARGIVVLNTPDANATTTAELAVAHILSLCRHLPAADQSVRNGKWERSKFMGVELAGKTLGVIGFGTIGRIVAARGLGMKMDVIAHDPFVADDVFVKTGVQPRNLDSLLREADLVTLHCPMTDKTRGLINAEKIKIMKSGALLINCARGGLIDEQALNDALLQGHLAGAALDVYEEEPPTNSPLLGLDNVVLTPHLGASTREAQLAAGLEIAKQVATYLDTGEAINAINLPSMATETALKVRPYQVLANKLSRLLAIMASNPITQIEVSLFGQIADYDSHPVAVAALAGLLNEYLSIPVNQVNAVNLAHRQGIKLIESRSDETHGYLSMLTIKAKQVYEEITVSGTLLDDRHPRLVRINDYELEAPLVGNLMFTRHGDQPGVVGAIGAVLGTANINISNMQVGVANDSNKAIAVIGISELLDEKCMAAIKEIPAISRVMQVAM